MIIMLLQRISIAELKSHYESLFLETNAAHTQDTFIAFISQVVSDLATGLQVDLTLMDKEYRDDIMCKTRTLGSLEALRRVLLPLAEAANYKATIHPDWSLLAGRIEVQRLKLQIPETWLEMLEVVPGVWRHDPEHDYYTFAKEHAEELEQMIVPERDYQMYFFGMRTLEKSYLMRIFNNGQQQFLETPQRLLLRVATFLWMPNLPAIKEYYDLMSLGYFTHASPTMFHAGIAKGSLASCFLLSMQDDLEKIFKCSKQCAMISKSAGGIGLDITNIRHSKIGHLGQSSGIVPMLQVYNAAMRYVDQGGRRKGSATIFLQPWHIDFYDFIFLKRNHGKEERRARDLFYAVWNCDLFMERVKADADWTMFCPKFAQHLRESFGEEFEYWYREYEHQVREMSHEQRSSCSHTMKARDVWNELLKTQIETGMPFMANKDTVNYTNNQKNLGLIRSSNLCMEITEVTDEDRISSCNLASLALDEYVKTVNKNKVYDFELLGEITRKVVRGLNRVIDRTYYPLMSNYNDKELEIITRVLNSRKGRMGESELFSIMQELCESKVEVTLPQLINLVEQFNAGGELIRGPGPIKSTNLKYRPLGLGVQALADTFLKMNLAWTDPEARKLNRDIFATIYYHAFDESIELAKELGPYDGFQDSPASQGILKPDMIAAERARRVLRKEGIRPNDPEFSVRHYQLTHKFLEQDLSPLYNWQALREKVAKYGLRNSLLIALMPTASSAQIRYKTESFEPMTSNLYIRSVLSGNHLVINRYMVDELIDLGLWNKSMINFIIKHEGSIQELPEELLPGNQERLRRLKEKCKTAFELKQRLLVDMSIDRCYYVCQSQSLNIFIKDPTFSQLSSLHFYAWENALSTGMYYLRSSAATEAVKFTVEGEVDVKKSVVCTDEVCLSCQ